MTCSAVRLRESATTAFCGECGAKLATRCPACGTPAPRARVLRRVRRAAGRGRPAAPAALRLARVLHPQAPRREDPHVQGRAGGRAQAGHGALRRSQGLDGAARRPRPRGGAQDPRPRPRAHDGGGPSVRGHRQPGDGRRDHGAVRRAPRPRGPRGAGVLCGAADAGVGQAVRRGGAPGAGRDGPASASG